MAMHKFLVDQDDARRGGVIHLRECPATQQRDARSSEVIDGHDNIECGEPLVGRQFRLALNAQSGAVRSGCGQVGSSGDGLRAGNVLEARNHVPDEEGLLAGILVSCGVERHAGGEEVVWPEAQILALNQ